MSKRFRKIFSDVEGAEIEYLNARIISQNGMTNDNFLCLNIINCFDGLDKEKSVFEVNRYGIFKIKKLFLTSEFMGNNLISRLSEKNLLLL